MFRHLTTFILGLFAMTHSAFPVPPDQNPVLLIHGIKDDARKMEPMARYLRKQGFTVFTMSLTPSWGQVSLDQLALQIDATAKLHFGNTRKFDLVAFSMGGLVARYYLQRLDGLARVQRFITLASPHHGTRLAHLIPNPGCRQMRPDSDFLQDLNATADQLQQIQFTSFWTPFDGIILPPRSSVMPGANNVKLYIALHPLMVYQTKCLQQVALTLTL